MFEGGESPEFSGKVVVTLAQDKNIMKLTGRVIVAAEYAQAHGIRDIDNRVILSFRQVKFLASRYLPDNLKFISNFVPSFVKIPQFVLDIIGSKF